MKKKSQIIKNTLVVLLISILVVNNFYFYIPGVTHFKISFMYHNEFLITTGEDIIRLRVDENGNMYENNKMNFFNRVKLYKLIILDENLFSKDNEYIDRSLNKYLKEGVSKDNFCYEDILWAKFYTFTIEYKNFKKEIKVARDDSINSEWAEILFENVWDLFYLDYISKNPY